MRRKVIGVQLIEFWTLMRCGKFTSDAEVPTANSFTPFRCKQQTPDAQLRIDLLLPN
jgi:hypothetical protein